ncbi:hypothetical protein D9Q98_006897 [Chlorella vulgaris]|uniref:Band 7 domain-containing protein n=1 Tax=Chlorella vulgaris TaxID=3077 RepID=A0A9D4TJ15_CHLVU|nr:hypothetical protein D9Q98_006897 [Chlorella vulgaris]
MGAVFTKTATGTIAAAGTKAASQPRKKNGALRRLGCCVCVDEANVEVVETFGKYSRVVKPGCNIVWCCFGQSAVGKLSTALQHQEVQCECKTKDGVFVELVFSVQYRVAEDKYYEAYYSLVDPAGQVTSYVLDAVGTAIASMDTEEVFEKRGQMVAEVQRGIGQVLLSHGFQVEDCLVTVMSPTASVKEAMSNVTATQRQRKAAWEQGEADKVRSIKAAEASSESKYLAGQGFARFFIAIAAGAREAVKVAVTGRLSEADLSFPEPPPANEPAALAAAGADHETRQQLNDNGSKGVAHLTHRQLQEQRKAPGAALRGSNGGLHQPLLEQQAPEQASKPARLGRANVSELLSPVPPPTPDKPRSLVGAIQPPAAVL